MPHVLKGTVACRWATKCNMVVGSDSLTNIMSAGGGQLLEAMHEVLPYNFRGGVCSPINAGSPFGVRCSAQFTTGGGMVAQAGPSSIGGIRPGEVFPDTTLGHNARRTHVCTFSGDVGSFGTPVNISVDPTKPYHKNWDTNASVKVGILMRTTPNSPAGWRLQSMNRSGANIDNTAITAQAAAGYAFTQSAAFSRGSGASDIISRVSTWNVDTEGGAITDFFQLAHEVEVQAATGIKWGNWGEGSYDMRWLSGSPVTADLPGDGVGAYTPQLTQAALDAEIAAFRWDVFVLLDGFNDYLWDGTTSANWELRKREQLAMIRSACNKVGITPAFLLISPHDGADDYRRTALYAAALERIAHEFGDVEFYDLRWKIESTYGRYSTWQASKLKDGVHYTKAFATEISGWLRDDVAASVAGIRVPFQISTADFASPGKVAQPY